MSENKNISTSHNDLNNELENSLLDGFIIFKLRNEHVAVRLQYVLEVFDTRKIRPIPRLSKKFMGIFNLRSEIIPILDFEYCVFENMSLNEQETKSNNKIVVISYLDQMFGINVEQIENINEFSSEDYLNVPDTVRSSIKEEFLIDMVKNEKDIVKILNIDGIMKSKFPYLEQFDSSGSKSLSVKKKKEDDSQSMKLQFSKDQKDAFREVMNIASGKAIIAMSKLMKKKVKIDINVEYVRIKDILELAQSNIVEPQEVIIGIRSAMSKDINGVIYLLFSLEKFALFLSEIELVQEKFENISTADDLTNNSRSTIQEIGNIIISHFCSAIADFLGIDLYHDVPQLAIAEYSAIVDGEIGRLSRDSDQAIFMKTKIQAKDIDIDSEILFIPYYDSIQKFGEWMNVDHVLTSLDKKKKQLLEKGVNVDKKEKILKPEKSKTQSKSEEKKASAKVAEKKETKPPKKEVKPSKSDVMNAVTPQKDYILDASISKKYKITGEDLDAFRELGNMGAGNAGNALSQILNKKVYLEIPPAKVLSVAELVKEFPKDQKMVGLIGTTVGFFTSNIFLFFEINHIENLLQELLGSKSKKKLLKLSDFEDSERSAVQEISSILMSHYVAAISNFIQKKIEPPEYQFFFKTVEDLFKGLDKISQDKTLEAIVVETKINVEENLEINGKFILILSPQIVQKVIKRINEVW